MPTCSRNRIELEYFQRRAISPPFHCLDQVCKATINDVPRPGTCAFVLGHASAVPMAMEMLTRPLSLQILVLITRLWTRLVRPKRRLIRAPALAAPLAPFVSVMVKGA